MYRCITVQGTSVSEMRPDTPYSDPTSVLLLAEDIPDIETLEITHADDIDSSAGAEETVDALLNPTDLDVDASMPDVLTDAEIAK